MKFLSFLTSLANMALVGLVLKKFWGWFLVEQFHIQAISWLQALGIYLVVDLVATGWNPLSKQDLEDMDDGEVLFTNQGIRCLSLLITFGIGWLIHLCM